MLYDACFLIIFLSLEFPEGCENFGGPNKVQCYESIWVKSGCTLAGEGRPGVLSRQELLRYDGMDIV